MNRITLLACSGALTGYLAVSASPLAHHGIGAQFDLSTSIELQGELESHWIYIPGLTVEPYQCLEG